MVRKTQNGKILILRANAKTFLPYRGVIHIATIPSTKEAKSQATFALDRDFPLPGAAALHQTSVPKLAHRNLTRRKKRITHDSELPPNHSPHIP